MNIGLGIVTLLFILVTAVFIFLKQRTIKSIGWNMALLLFSGLALWFGKDASDLWLILFCSMAVGLCLIMAVVHSYNQLFASGKTYDSVGESKKPRTFGNGYWR